MAAVYVSQHRPDVPIELIGELYRSASFLNRAHYRNWALRTVDKAIRFDAALWATGHPLTPNFSQALTIALPPDFPHTLEKFGEDDPIAHLATSPADGKTASVEFTTASLADKPEVQANYQRHGIRHAVAARYVHPISSISNTVALFCFDGASACEAAATEMLEVLAYALVDAASLCYFLHIAFPSGFERRKAAAVCSPDGLLLEAQPRFLSLMTETFPGWSGPRLPFVPDELAAGSKHVHEKLLAQAEPFENLRCVRIWPPSELDELSPRELDLTHGVIEGQTDKEIAAELGLCVSTVANRLHEIFRKLRVANRQHLRRRFAALR